MLQPGRQLLAHHRDVTEAMSLLFKLIAREAEVLRRVIKGKINRDSVDIRGLPGQGRRASIAPGRPSGLRTLPH